MLVFLCVIFNTYIYIISKIRSYVRFVLFILDFYYVIKEGFVCLDVIIKVNVIILNCYC